MGSLTSNQILRLLLPLSVLTYKDSGVILNTDSAAHQQYSSGAKGCLLDKTEFVEFLLLFLFPGWVCGRWRAAAVGASLRGCRSPSHRGGASVLEELLHDRGVGQRGDVAHVSFVTGDFAEHPAHDLTCTQRRTQVMTVSVCLM